MNFQEFLQGKHAEQYSGTDDDMPDDFERWFEEEVFPENVSKWAQEWHDSFYNYKSQ